MVQSVKIRLSIQGPWAPSVAGGRRRHVAQGGEARPHTCGARGRQKPARNCRAHALWSRVQPGKDPDCQPRWKDSACCKEDPPHRVAQKAKFKKLLFKWPTIIFDNLPAAAKSLQSCPTLCDPIDGSPPGSPIPGFSRQEHWSGLPFPSPVRGGEKWQRSRSVVSDSLWPHGLQPTRLLRPWDVPGKSTGVGYHCLLQKTFLEYG